MYVLSSASVSFTTLLLASENPPPKAEGEKGLRAQMKKGLPAQRTTAWQRMSMGSGAAGVVE
jgi:hypothetical protein